MTKQVFLLLFAIFCYQFARAQASFSSPDTVCVNTPVNIVNTSGAGTSYYWNFSVADINKTPTGVNLGNIGGQLSSPVFIDVVSDNGKYYGFLTDFNNGRLIRFNFGNSMLNTPTATNLGDFGVFPQTQGTEGIQVIKNNGKWYAIIVGGGPSANNTGRIIKIDFGTNIQNPAPIATNWGNLGNLAMPIDLNMFQENGKWYGFTVNAENNTVTRFDFGTDFTNPPIATNLGNFNGLLDYPTGINAIYENNKWYVFITNATNSTITRLDFGNSLTNTPVAKDLGNPGSALSHPRDIIVLRFCGQLIGFVTNGKDPNSNTANDLTKLDFNDLITNTPTGASMGNVANFDFPHSLSRLFREGADLYTFIPNVYNNTLSRLKFSGSTDVNIPSSTAQTPPTITYSKPGIYNVNLLLDEGLPTQSSFCKSIVVVAPETHFLGEDVSTCDKTYAIDATKPNAKSYLWSTGEKTASIAVNTTGDYWVEIQIAGKPCPSRDTINITFKTCAVAGFTTPDTVCVNTPVNITNTSTLGTSFYWNFSVADINKTPTGVNLGNIGGQLSSPVFIDVVSDNNKYYGFLTDFNNGKLIRFDFGNSMLNTPTATNLGDFGVFPQTQGTEGIQVVKNNGKWYAIIVGGGPSAGNTGRIIKIDFGTNIQNPAPIVTNWGNLGNLAMPIDLNMFQENGKWYGFTVNSENNTVTRFDFGTDFTNPPVATNLGTFNGLLDYPTGINAIYENGNWYVFITNATNSTITRLDFGSSLTNTPVAKDLGNPSSSLSHPRDIIVLRFCGQLIGFVANGKDPNSNTANDLTKLDFNDLITNNPTGVSMGNIADFDFPHSLSRIFREGADLYTFIPNVYNNTLSRLKFTGSSDVNIPNSTLGTPPTITYSKPGIYNINLLMDEGLPTQTSFCKSIVVMAPLSKFLGDDISTCNSSYKIDATQPNAKTYLWSNGAKTPTITVSTSGDYWVEIAIAGNPCPSRDTLHIDFKNCPVASFAAPDTVCVNTPVTITNTSNLATNFFWNFCVANVSQPPIGDNMGQLGGYFDKPVYIDYVLDNGKYYGFVTNNGNGTLSRLDFGTSLLNTPIVTDLGSINGVIQRAAEGVQVIKNEGKWYVIIVGGDGDVAPASISTIELGTNITNNSPIGTNWGNIGEMAYPHDLYVFNDNNKWYGITANTYSNTITRFDFTSSFSNTPTGVNLGNVGNLVFPTGLHALQDNNNWYVFITNANGQNISRLDFGGSLLSTPTGVNLGNIGNQFKTPWDIYVMKFCDSTIAFVSNSADGTLTKLNFGNSLLNVPTATTFPNLGNQSFPHCLSKIFRVGADLFTFITNVDNNTVTRLKFSGCTDASIPNSSLQTPPPVTYSKPGTYNINLTIDEGLPTQSSFCKSVVVLPAPDPRPLVDTAICKGDSVLLKTNFSLGEYLWSTGSTDTAIIVKAAGDFFVQYDYFGCKGKDDFKTVLNELPMLDLGANASICKNDSLLLDPKNLGAKFLWQDKKTDSVYWAKQAGDYTVAVTDANGCTNRDTVAVSVWQLPVIGLPDSSAYCKNDSLLLDAGKNAITYLWNDGTDTQTLWGKTVGDYFVEVKDANGCINKDSIYISERALPIVDLVKDTSICVNDSLTLDAGTTATIYQWQDGSSKNTFKVKDAGFYKVNITDQYGCKNADSVTISSLALPVVTLADNAAICKNDSLLLDAGNNGVEYLWMDGTTASTLWAKQGGQYTVAVKGANSCTNRDTINISILQLPVIALADNVAICIGSTAQITANAATAIKYDWQASPTLSAINIANPVASPTDTTTYYLKVTDNNNCTNKDSIAVFVVAVPTVSPLKDTTICIGSSIVLKTQSTSTNKFEWTPATTLNNAALANPTATPAVKTTYTVKASNDGCSTTGQVTVDINPLPTIAKSNDTTICIPGSAQLKVSGGTSYSWSPLAGLSNPNIADPVATALVNTFYKAKVTDANGCIKIDSVFVKVLPKPVFAIDPANPAICIGDSALITASGGDIYNWQPQKNILHPGEPSVTVYPSATSDYSVTIKNTTCNVSDIVMAHVKVNPLPTITMSRSNDIDCLNPSTHITASGGVEYNWWPTTYLNDPGAISPVAEVTTNTMFYVKVTDRNTCASTDSIMVNVTHDGEQMFVVPNAFTPNGDGQNDCFNIRHWGINNKLIEFSIYDRWGVKVWSTTNINDCWDGTFKGQMQPSGGFVYIIHAKTICGDIVRKGMVILIR